MAEEYGMSRSGIYSYLEWVEDDPEEKLRRAEEELEFRKEVLRLLS